MSDTDASSDDSKTSILRRLFYSRTLYSSQRRLLTQIEDLRAKVKGWEERAIGDENSIADIRRHLDSAERDAKIRHTESGWWHLNSAWRAAMALMPEPEFNSFVIGLRHEFESKLSGWRLDATRDIVTKSEKTDVDLETRRLLLSRAAKVLHEHFDNLYRNKEIVKSHIGILMMTLCIGLLLFFVLFGGFVLLAGCSIGLADTAACFPETFDDVACGLSFFVFLLMCFSLALTASSISAIMGMASSQRVPNQFDDLRITVARAIIGGASGPLAFFLVDAEIINGLTSPSHTLIIAFALGFSQKLLVGVMDRVSSAAGVTKSEKK